MVRRVFGVVTFSITLFASPGLALAQWYVSPYVGKVAKVENPYKDVTFVPTDTEKTTVFGIAGGTNPFAKIGVEIDYQRVNSLFGKADVLGDNKLQTITAAAHIGKAFANGRVRPYGVVGGGLHIIHLGSDFDIDYDAYDALPPAQQLAIENCLFNLGYGENGPSPTQFRTCGMPGSDENLVGYRGALTFGGGVHIKLAKHVAAKADVRYFMQVPEEEGAPFTFWRVTVGVVLHR